MSLQVTFKNMDSSEALEQYARQKIEDVLQKFMSAGPTNVQITFHISNLEHIAHCDLHLGSKGRNISIDATAESMYASVDKLVDKLQRQLRKEKSRLVDHKQHQSKFDRAELAEESDKLEKEAAAAAEVIDADDIVKFEKVRGGGTFGS